MVSKKMDASSPIEKQPVTRMKIHEALKRVNPLKLNEDDKELVDHLVIDL
jgi:hypothetical protein